MERDIEQLRSQPHWSYTALNTYLNICQLKFYYQYIENAERERTSSCFAFGRAFHAVLSERAIKGRDFSKAEAVSSFAFYLEHEIKAESYRINCRERNLILAGVYETQDDPKVAKTAVLSRCG